MWEDAAYRERTYHSHGNYPAVDTYNFYLSYHGMIVVAAKLLKEMPAVKGLYDEENPWEYWITGHLPAGMSIYSSGKLGFVILLKIDFRDILAVFVENTRFM